MTDASFQYSGTELEAMANAPNYYRAILRRFAPYLGSRVVEVGAGVGTFSELLAEVPTVSRLTLLEPALNNFTRLRERFKDDARVETVNSYLEKVGEANSADSIVLVNVLEHIPDDAMFLDAARRVLVPGGRILIFVPAMPVIFGTLDEAFDHHRRYSRPQLTIRLEGSGFKVATMHHMNLPGAFIWFMIGRVLRRTTLTPRNVRMYDRWVVPWMEKLEGLHPPPFGQSLLAIAEANR